MAVPTKRFSLVSTGFSDDTIVNTFDTDDINLRINGANTNKLFNQYVYIGSVADYTTNPNPGTITNPCFEHFLADNETITVKGISYNLSNNWGNFKTLFPNGFALFSIEEKSNTNSLSFKIKNPYSTPYTITNFSSFITTRDSSKTTFSYSIYDASGVESKKPVTFPSGLLSASTRETSITIPANGVLSIDGSTTLKSSSNRVYMLLSLESVIYTKPQLSFSSQTVTTRYNDGKILIPISVNARQNINMDSLELPVTFRITKPNSSFTPISKQLSLIKGINGQHNATILEYDTAIYEQLKVGTYEIIVSFLASENYLSMDSTKLTYVIEQNELSTDFLISGNNIYYTDSCALTYKITNQDEIGGTVTFRIKDNANGTTLQTLTNDVSSWNKPVKTFTKSFIPLNFLNLIPGNTYKVSAEFISNTNEHQKPPIKEVTFAIYSINLKLNFVNSPFEYSRDVSFNVLPYSNERPFSEFNNFLGDTSIDVTINNNTKVTLNFDGSKMNYNYIGNLSNIPYGSYTATASDVKALVNYSHSSIKPNLTSINPSVPTSFTIISFPTALNIQNVESTFNIPVTTIATYSGIPNGTITGFTLKNSNNDLQTFDEIKALDNAVSITFNPLNLGVDSTGNPFNFTLNWTDPTNNYQSLSSPFTIKGLNNTINTYLDIIIDEGEGVTSTIETELNFEFIILSSTDQKEGSDLPDAVYNGTLRLYGNDVLLKTLQLQNKQKTINIPLKPDTDISDIKPGSYSFYVTYETNADYHLVKSRTVIFNLSKANTSVTLLLKNNLDSIVSNILLNDIIYLESKATSTLGKNITGTLSYNFVGKADVEMKITESSPGDFKTDNFTPLEKGISTGGYKITATFTPSNLINYSGSTFSFDNLSFIAPSLEFPTISFDPVTYLDNIVLNIAIKPLKKADDSNVELPGKLSVSLGDYKFERDLKFENNEIKNIPLGKTPKIFGLTVLNTSNLTVRFTPTNLDINYFQQSVQITVNPHQVSLNLVNDNTKSEYYFNDTQNIKVNVSPDSSSISGNIKLHIDSTEITSVSILNANKIEIPISLNNFYSQGISQKTSFGIYASFVSSDTNYSNLLNSSPITVTYILNPVSIKTFIIDGTSVTDLLEVDKDLNEKIDVSGTLIDSNNQPVKGGTVSINGETGVVGLDGAFNFSVLNISSNGLYKLSYTNSINYVPKTYGFDENGTFFVNIVKSEYTYKMTEETNGYTDYVDGLFTFKTELNVGEALFTNIIEGDGKFVYNIYTIDEEDNQNNLYTITDAIITKTSTLTTASYTFNPKKIGLNAGDYYISCSFSGITDKLGDTSTSLEFKVDKTQVKYSKLISLQEYYNDFNVSNKNLNFHSGESITSWTYKQRPFLNIKVGTTATIDSDYKQQFGNYPDIPCKVKLNVTDFDFMNNVDGAYNEPNNDKHGSVTKDTQLIIENIKNVKILQFLVHIPGDFNITGTVEVTDTVNYINADISISFTINKYQPVILQDTLSLYVLTALGEEVPENPDGTYNDPVPSSITSTLYLPKNAITYEDQFKVVNKLKQYDTYKTYNIKDTTGTNIDYSGINGKININYSYNPPISPNFSLTSSQYITNTDDQLTWTSIVQPNIFDQGNPPTTQFMLYLQMIPYEQDLYIDSSEVSIHLYVYQASALGTFEFTRLPSGPSSDNPIVIPEQTPSFSWANGINIKGIMKFDDSVNSNYTTGKFAFSYQWETNSTNKYGAVDTISIDEVDTSNVLLQNFEYKIQSSISIIASSSPYTIAATFTNDSNNYLPINGAPIVFFCDPTLTLSTPNPSPIEYTRSSIIKANLACGTEYSGGLATFSFKDSSNNLVASYAMAFTNNIAEFNISLVNDITKTSATVSSLLLAGKTYTLSCEASFSDNTFRGVKQQSTVNIVITNLTYPITSILIDKNLYNYKEYTPTFTVNFSDLIYGETITWTLLSTSGNNNRVFTQVLTNQVTGDSTQIPPILGPSNTYTYQLVEGENPYILNVDTYTISASYSSTNFGNSQSSSIKFLVNPSMVSINSLSKFYVNPLQLSARLSNLSITDGTIIFNIVGTNTSFIGSYLEGSYKTPLLSISPGAYEMIVYYSGNSSYNTNYNFTPLNINVIFNKNQNIDAVDVTVTAPTINTGVNSNTNPLYYTLNTPVQTLDNLYVYSDLQKEPLARSTGNSNVLLDDSLLKTGVNNLYVVVNNKSKVTVPKKVTITKPKTDTFITLTSSLSEVSYNSSVKLTATLTNTRGYTINDGQVIYTVNGSVVGQTNVINNSCIFDHNLYEMGPVSIVATFTNSLDFVDSTSSTVTVNVTKADLTISLLDTTPSSNSISNIKVIHVLVGTQPNTINTGTVDVYDNDILLYDEVEVNNGIASFDLLLETNHVLRAIFNGNNRYNSASSVTNLTITPTKGDITQYYSKATYDFDSSEGFITVTSCVTPVTSSTFYKNSGYVQFIFNTVTINVPLLDGKASTKFVSLTDDTSSLSVTYFNNNYNGNINHNRVVTSAVLKYNQPSTLVLNSSYTFTIYTTDNPNCYFSVYYGEKYTNKYEYLDNNITNVTDRLLYDKSKANIFYSTSNYSRSNYNISEPLKYFPTLYILNDWIKCDGKSYTTNPIIIIPNKNIYIVEQYVQNLKAYKLSNNDSLDIKAVRQTIIHEIIINNISNNNTYFYYNYSENGVTNKVTWNLV